MYKNAKTLIGEFFVAGTPRPKGSYVPARRKDGSMYLIPQGKNMKGWERAVTAAASAVLPKCDVKTRIFFVSLVFCMPRPLAHYRGGKNTNPLKPTAPFYAISPPDIDKLERTVYDGLVKAGSIADDSQIAAGDQVKVYAEHNGEGVWVRVFELGEAGVPFESVQQTANQRDDHSC